MDEKNISGIDSIIQINYLTPENSTFTVTENGFLKLTATVENPEKDNAVEKLEFERVFLHRSFPFSNPYKFISALGQFPKKEPEKKEDGTPPPEEDAEAKKKKDEFEKIKKNNEVTSFGELKEIGVISDLGDFGPELAEKMRAILDKKYFMPVIREITDVKEKYGYSHWTVITDAGKAKFTVPDPHRNIFKLGDSRIIVSDINGNRYDIRNVEEMSAASLRKIDLFL